MPHIERQGVRIHYEVSGAGPVVLLGHSLLCDGRMWEGVVPTLAERYRVIIVDSRGLGPSTTAGAFTLYDLADDWLAILDQEDVDQTAICGLSMGGMTGMRFALAHPDRVAALALLDTSADPEPRANRIKYRIMASMLRRFGPLRLLTNAVAELMFGRTTRRDRPELVSRQLDRVREQDREGLYWAARSAVAARDPIRHELGKIGCPVRVIVGDQDRATPPVLSRRIRDAIPAAELVVLPETGHLSAIESPEAVADTLREFLDPLSWA